jgi:hypothetical protein
LGAPLPKLTIRSDGLEQAGMNEGTSVDEDEPAVKNP